MHNYWLARYLETMSQVDAATSPSVRSAYLKLADHYKAMQRFCVRSGSRDYMLAA